VSALNKEESNRKHDRESIDENVPVHGHGSDWSSLGEESENEDNDEVDDREVVDGTAPFAHAPASGWERLLPPALDADASDRDDVRGEKGGGAEGGDGVEGGIGADID
jgi:hypothetical protein